MKYLITLALFYVLIGQVYSSTTSPIYTVSGYEIFSTNIERRTDFARQDFSAEETEQLYQIIKELPAQLKFLKGVEGLYRLQSNTIYSGFENSAATAQSAITNELGEIKQLGHILITDLFFLQSKSSQKLTLIHEFCHQLDYQPLYLGKPPHSIDPSEEFISISKEDHGYVTYYAKDGGVFEDFAESCAYHFLDPKRLSFRSPKRASYFKMLIKKYSF